ncbi:MAG: LytTR family DNA-binding domain-containing protein [Bacteroidota bacterium]|nr:LytTR family DNA-binding domain-containing protein [Bacteroidota bacterium]
MLSCVLIDDEQDSLIALKKLLVNFTYVPVRIVGEATNLDNGIQLIKDTLPDIVFLDINMPGKNGMDIYKYFDNPQFKVVFITEYSQFAIEAIKKSASDYLLKPVNFIELNESIKRISAQFKWEQHQREVENKENLINVPEMEGKNVVLNVEHGFLIENTKNIEYCYADQSYSVIVTCTGKKILVTKPLKYLEKLFPANQFYRTHKSYLVNIYYIRRYVKSDENYLLLRSGIKIPVSVRKSSGIDGEIKKLFEG